MPETPILPASSGPPTSDMTKEVPMLMPMKAIARVREAARVRSASSAITGPETAPMPCTVRASMSAQAVAAK